MELNREHFRAIMYYNFQRQLSQQECLAELLSVFGNEAPHQSTISRWYGEFKRGRVSLSDDPRVGAPKSAVTQENLVSKTLDRFNSGNSIVSGDESWIYCYEPENKRHSAVWVCQGEEKPKVIRSRSVSKRWSRHFVSIAGHIATIPLNEQRTVTADWYTPFVCQKIILHQDNASSHTAQKTRQYLTEENVELLDHSPYKEAVDAFKNAVLDLPANEWNKCFENWYERMQMCINLRENTSKNNKVS
ncbi:unnamed protein product [Acanthoscelides obtectus]|uniref:Mos1 transposase HTH domain-containing protein n=1 Tax=Acanthoscelides obtectus TaxID=200917 RepID=A0A9P0QJ85_ACAOB|nr:unnamed protein product [Acanthoscelides obtectus]CAK1685563.1 hypothetical protein AOBTE_LOCUS35510 [Acanthoscelides obtectus]